MPKPLAALVCLVAILGFFVLPGLIPVVMLATVVYCLAYVLTHLP